MISNKNFSPSFKEFLSYSKKGNLIPVYKQINADLDTPVSAFLKIKKDEYAFLLESIEGQEKVARYSFLGSKPQLILRSKGNKVEIIYPRKAKADDSTVCGNPISVIKKILEDYRAVNIPGLPRFFGGLVGYIGYDMVKFFEDIPDKNPDDLGLPDSFFLLTDTILIFDHVKHNIKIVYNLKLPKGKDTGARLKKKLYDQACSRILEIEENFNQTAGRVKKTQVTRKELRITSNFGKKHFCAAVRAAQEYIKSGDIIQVVLSQRFKTNLDKDPFSVYRALRNINPSPYMFYLKFGSLNLIGSSPEMLVRCEEKIVQTRPIAGTRPRGADDRTDEKLGKQLYNDTKERAEHLMLVDLGRNDLGKVSKPGKVEVSEFMKVEKYSHVMHLVSEVKGSLKENCDAFDVLEACFPAGTVSGSPKIRAMEIIDELENTKRGPYAGCVGYFSFSRNMDACITIRTIIMKNNVAYVQAGAGIVADSVPEKEYNETVNKARGMFEALADIS